MLIVLALILLAASFVGFWSQRHSLKPTTQSIIASGYFLIAVTVVFGGAML